MLYRRGRFQDTRLEKSIAIVTVWAWTFSPDVGRGMIKVLRENWALFAGMLMLMAANGLLVTVLTIRGHRWVFPKR